MSFPIGSNSFFSSYTSKLNGPAATQLAPLMTEAAGADGKLDKQELDTLIEKTGKADASEAHKSISSFLKEMRDKGGLDELAKLDGDASGISVDDINKLQEMIAQTEVGGETEGAEEVMGGTAPDYAGPGSYEPSKPEEVFQTPSSYDPSGSTSQSVDGDVSATSEDFAASAANAVDGAGVTQNDAMAKLAGTGRDSASNLNSRGWCLRGVNDALDAAGLSIGRQGHAYQAAPVLAKDPRFQEIKVDRNNLEKLPAGAVIVWDKSGSARSGHIQITQGNGKATSDHFESPMTKLNGSYRVFIPKGKKA